MKAVLQILFGYFEFLPFQRWLNIIGAVLLVAGILLTLGASNPKNAINFAIFPGLIGAFLIVIAPFGFGGFALRLASSRALLHLRPRGRIRILLGATLTITLVATVVMLPILAEHHFFVARGYRVPSGVQPAGWFMGAWASMAATWLIMFIASSSRLLMTMTTPTIFATMFLASRADKLDIADPDGRIVMAVALAAWVAFAIWYLRTPKVSGMDWMRKSPPLGSSGFGNFMRGPARQQAAITENASPTHALRLYLFGAASIPTLVAASALPALMLMAMASLWSERQQSILNPAFYMFIFAVGPASVGFLLARQARFLWLKSGRNRTGLFRLAERFGLLVALLMYGTGTAILLAATTLGRQEEIAVTLLYLGTLGTLAIFLFYFGFGLTRGWNRPDAMLGLGIISVVGFMLFAIHPLHEPTTTTIWFAAGLFALLTPLLRWHAARRWRTLDWRIAQLPRMGRRIA